MEEDWRRFLKQYSTDDVDYQQEEEEAYNRIECGHKIPSMQLQGLDPRIAELVLQLQHSKPCSSGTDTEDWGPDNEETNGDEDEEDNMHMFLPLLIEDTSRDSAWAYGSSIRRLAYTMLLHYMPILPPYSTAEKRQSSRRIKEYQRRGTRIVGLPIDLDLDFASNGINSRIAILLHSIHSHEMRSASAQSEPTTEIIPIASTSRFWKAYALDLASEQRLLNAKPLPDADWVKGYLTPELLSYKPTSWDHVHNQATIEAVLYSLRMLKQITSLVIRFASSNTGEDETEDGEELKVGVKELIDVLANLPPIDELMDPEPVAISRLQEQDEDGEKKSEVARESQTRDQGMMDFRTQPQNEGTTNHDRLPCGTLSNLPHDLAGRTKRQKPNSRSKHEKNAVPDGAARARSITVGNRFAALQMHE